MPKGKPKLKTAVMTLRVDPQIKRAAERAAKEDHRSLTNFVEVLILSHCQKAGIADDSLKPGNGKQTGGAE